MISKIRREIQWGGVVAEFFRDLQLRDQMFIPHSVIFVGRGVAAFFPPAFFPPAFFPPGFCPSAFFPPQAAILPPVDCDYILSYSIHSLTLLFALLNMLSHCCVVLACSVAPN